MISRIKKETELELTRSFIKMMAALSGSGLPSNVNVCKDFNKGSCEKMTIHSDDTIHICALCEELFGAGFFHPAISCKMLESIDNDTSDDDTSEDDTLDDDTSEEEDSSNLEQGNTQWLQMNHYA